MAESTENSWDGILQPGESLLWQGRPAPIAPLTALNWGQGAMGLFFTGFSIFWMILAAQSGGVMWMFGLIFLGIGLRMSLGQVLLDPWIRAQTVYSLTDKRAFIATRHPLTGRRLDIYDLTPRSEITLVEGTSKGRPDALYFAVREKFGRHGESFERRVGFENLADAAEPHRILRQITKAPT